MGDKPWKVSERKAAKAFGGVRNRMSGAVNQLTHGDVVHPILYIECKYKKRHTALTLMRETEKRAKLEGKIPVVCLQDAGDDTRYYIVNEKDLKKLAKAAV